GTAVETVLRESGELADLEAVAQSWFEDGPDIAQAIAGAPARNRAKGVTYLLQSVIARHRDKLADLLLRTALWMRGGPSETDLWWRELGIVGKAVGNGRDMAEIGLMRDIAQRTLAVLANASVSSIALIMSCPASRSGRRPLRSGPLAGLIGKA